MRNYLVIPLLFLLIALPFLLSVDVFAQGPEYQEIHGQYTNEEFGFSFVLPENLKGFVYENDNPVVGKIMNMQIHPKMNSEEGCCPSVDTSEVTILLDSHPLNMLATPVPLTGDIYAAFQGYDMDVSIENLGKLQVLTSTVEIEREYPPDYPEPIKRIGKFYFVNTEDRYLSYGIFASGDNFEKYIDIFEESAETLSVADAKPIDLGAIFLNPIETQITLKDNSVISANVMSPSIINSVTLEEDSKTFQINISEPNNFRSFLAVNVGDILDGPYTVTYDKNPRETQTIENESGRYLLLFYSGEGIHDITITGANIKNDLSVTQENAPINTTNYDLPLKQLKSGISIDEIKCKPDLQKMLKHDGKTPVCVKPETAPKLIERNWAKIPIPETHNDDKTSKTSHNVPIHVYEIWQSSGVIIHGMVDIPKDDGVVTINITDDQDDLIETIQVRPDDSGRFVHGITKTNSVWQNVSSYTVTADYTNPVQLDNQDILDTVSSSLNKDVIPLSSEQISQMSHNQVITAIEEWVEIGGNSPFTVMSTIGVKDDYALGESMPFFIQKSGYGNPCHDQGVMIFNEFTQTRVATGFYLEMCNSEDEKVTVPFNYVVPYNQGIFVKLAPIMEPGNYVMVTGTNDENSKHKKRFTVSDSSYIHDYNITYDLYKDSKDNTQSMKIDLNSGKIIIKDTNGIVRESSINQDTLHRINAEIIENGLTVNPWNNHKIGDDCDTCSFGIIKIMIDDVLVHFLVFDDASLISDDNNPINIRAGSPYLFSLVDCVASQNNFDTFWISDSTILSSSNSNDYEDCSVIGGERDKDIIPKYGKDDYEFLVNGKPKPGTPPNAGPLAGAHEHASILVKIFGDKFDFSKSAFQIKNPYIHFEGSDGDTIHRHADNVTLGFLFETMNMQITDDCFVFSDDRSFCNNDDYPLQFFINGEMVDSISQYVVSNNDRILISYGVQTEEEINSQLDELNSQKIIS